ncbi:MAG TPA: inositol monophosphatase family protein [Brevundimonas sp.]|uniref:inositol monophosphatase family protein n=1 Tax=Brevundimonas sp. TaxID=1871086 RepID=UPI002BCCDD53|nr:inositol monophosphatase family protein [Brevundimonas sp.]HRH20422.1 inositol monophosphatase family protein [Brevundimonas sp.]
MAHLSPVLSVMVDAVKKAARPMMRDFGEVAALQVSRKGPGDFVSAADLKAEQTLFEALMKARPGYGFLGEERGLIEGSDKSHTFIVDPIDGTTNFLHAMPHFAVAVALEREGEIQAGVIYNPIINELFWAEKGKGAFLNDARIRVSGRRELADSLIGTGLPFIGRPGHGQSIKEIHAVGQRVAGIRRLGSAALDLAWVAAGRYDAFWERNLNPWDVAAGLLLVTEAGGTVTGIDNDHDPRSGVSVCVGAPDIQTQLLKHLRAA